MEDCQGQTRRLEMKASTLAKQGRRMAVGRRQRPHGYDRTFQRKCLTLLRWGFDKSIPEISRLSD